ncbi:MAG: 3-dehydroquinate synthase [Chthoniobacterales bacterium]
MSTTIPVTTANGNYPIHVGTGLLHSAGKIIRDTLTSKRLAIITDANVGALYGKKLEDSLLEAGFAPITITIPPGEGSKSFAAIEKICDQMISHGLDRSSAVVALGGGVVGDLAGFAASIYFRGIPIIQIPTSIVAQVDSAIGGKTGINSHLGKNLIGAFHQPKAVIIDPALLKTLPPRERNEGFAEIIKHAAIRDVTMLSELECKTPEQWEALIRRNAQIKAEIVSADVYEKSGLRALLNFGHTIGHGIEQAAGYGKLWHGEAISLGLIAACRISEKRAKLTPEATAAILTALKTFKLPTQLPTEISTEAIIQALRHDKKFTDGEIRFVLTNSLGSAFLSRDVTLEDILEAIESLRS